MGKILKSPWEKFHKVSGHKGDIGGAAMYGAGRKFPEIFGLKDPGNLPYV